MTKNQLRKINLHTTAWGALTVSFLTPQEWMKVFCVLTALVALIGYFLTGDE